LVSPAFVTTQAVPLVQVGVIPEVAVDVPDWLKVLKAIVEADTEHVPVTVPEVAIVPEDVAAKVLFAEDKSNVEVISSIFFKLFFFINFKLVSNI
jgi:hypothetical protein